MLEQLPEMLQTDSIFVFQRKSAHTRKKQVSSRFYDRDHCMYFTRGETKFSLNSATFKLNLLEPCNNYSSYDSFKINYSHCQGLTIGRMIFFKMHAFVPEQKKL